MVAPEGAIETRECLRCQQHTRQKRSDHGWLCLQCRHYEVEDGLSPRSALIGFILVLLLILITHLACE